MKHLILCFSIIILACAIYFKPISNRYTFDKFDDGITIITTLKDTATGKIYEWNHSTTQGIKDTVNIIDPIRNKKSISVQRIEKYIRNGEEPK